MGSADIGDLKDWYRYHGLLLAIGFGILLPLSYIFARFGVIRPEKLMKNYFYAIHVLLSISGFVCIGGGFYFSIKYFPGDFSDRARKFHPLLGLITIGLLLLIAFVGSLQFSLSKKRSPLGVWLHKLSGIFVLLFSIFVNVNGILKYHDRTKDKNYLIFVAVYCAVVFTLTLFYFVLLCVSPYKEIKKEEDPLEAKATAMGEFDDESWPPEEVIFGSKKTAPEGQEGPKIPAENGNRSATSAPNANNSARESPSTSNNSNYQASWANQRPKPNQRLRPSEH